ncbi:MAG: kinase, partial [SAR86 cluster bacterium]
MYQQLISNFVKQEALPQSYTEDSRQWFLPLVDEIEKRLKAASESPIIIGINGAQGTGKSTLAKLISLVLNAKRYSVANLSIDDFYFSKAKRLELANEQHSLLASRGVPGTHDVQQLLQI